MTSYVVCTLWVKEGSDSPFWFNLKHGLPTCVYVSLPLTSGGKHHYNIPLAVQQLESLENLEEGETRSIFLEGEQVRLITPAMKKNDLVLQQN